MLVRNKPVFRNYVLIYGMRSELFSDDVLQLTSSQFFATEITYHKI